ncbi:MAG: flagellin [Opitutaceae bacterium]
MSVVINTNTAASVAANNLAYSTSMLNESLNKLSSGSRIVNPSDDAGGLAVSMKLTATANRDTDLEDNVNDAVSLLQTQDGALQVAGSILDRMSQLETLYQDPTKNSSDQANYDDEFTQLQAELTTLTQQTFNSVSLFGTGQTLSVYTTDDLSSANAIGVTEQALSNTSTGVGAITATGVSSLGSTGLGTTAADRLTTITDAIQNVATMRAVNGGEQSRLNFASTLLTTNETNLQAANSAISDVDVAQETTNLAKWNVLVQAGASMLTQANQSSQIALKLITG